MLVTETICLGRIAALVIWPVRSAQSASFPILGRGLLLETLLRIVSISVLVSCNVMVGVYVCICDFKADVEGDCSLLYVDLTMEKGNKGRTRSGVVIRSTTDKG